MELDADHAVGKKSFRSLHLLTGADKTSKEDIIERKRAAGKKEKSLLRRKIFLSKSRK